MLFSAGPLERAGMDVAKLCLDPRGRPPRLAPSSLVSRLRTPRRFPLPKSLNPDLPLAHSCRRAATRSHCDQEHGRPSVKPAEEADRELALRHQQARERSRQGIDLVIVRSRREEAKFFEKIIVPVRALDQQ